MKRIAISLILFSTFGSLAHAAEPSTNTYTIMVPSTPEFVPTKVWDDGKFTFIELQKPYAGELPAVYRLAEDGTRELVNFTWDQQNSRFVIRQLVAHAVLALGNKSVIVNRT